MVLLQLQNTKKFIESEDFPVEIVMAASQKEKGPGRPPFWEMLFWWTRKPLAGARALLLAAALDQDQVKNPLDFIKAIYPSYDPVKSKKQGKPVFKHTPHRDNPRLPPSWRQTLEKLSMADPMAGYGNIPLEAIRLGYREVYAWDLLPMARLILRAVLEIPQWLKQNNLDKEFIQDLEKIGNQIIENLKNDPDIQELYDPDTAVYIGTWEVKCPYCQRYTPLIGNWWLARVKQGNNYKALAYMKPIKQNDTIQIQVIDLTSKLKNNKQVQVTKSTIKIGNETYHLPNNGEPNIRARNMTATCLHCGAQIKGNKQNWHIKQAIQEYNKKLEQYLNGQITLQQLKQSTARPRLLVKVKTKDKQLIFQPATSEDQEKLWLALEKLKQIWPDPDIPTEPIPEYDSRNFMTYGWGNDKWFKLFNARQLLLLIKLIKQIRKISKNKEKKSNKIDIYYKYKQAIMTYLTLALSKIVDYNSLLTRWKPDSWVLNKTQSSLSFRGISIGWNWTETNLKSDIQYSFISLMKNIIETINYLLQTYDKNIKIITNLVNNKKVTIIISDPPYRDDVPYTELSDFYYVWAKRALSDVDPVRGLVPRFHSDLFFDEFGGEIRTQWERYAVYEVSYNEGRMKYFGLCGSKAECERVFRERFREMIGWLSSMVKDDGLLVLYFAHSSPEAFVDLVDAASHSDLWVSAGFPLATESAESIVSRGKVAILHSIVLVMRKGRHGTLDLGVKEESLVEDLAGFVERVYPRREGMTAYVMTFARALGGLMRYESVVRGHRKLGAGDVVREAARLTALAFSRRCRSRVRGREAVLYLLLKQAVPRPVNGYRRVASDSLIMYSYGTLDVGSLVSSGVVRGAGKSREGADVAKRKEFVLLEPIKLPVNESEYAVLARLVPRENGLYRPRHSLDVYRILALYSFRPKKTFLDVYYELAGEYPDLVADAVELARALSGLGDDPDAEVSRRILEYLGEDPGCREVGERRRGEKSIVEYLYA